MGAKILILHAGTPRFLRRFFLCATAVLIAAAVCFVGCGKGGGSIAGKEPIKRVIKVESNVDALSAWAANGAKASVLVHVDPLDDMAAFPVSLMEDMKNAAGHLKRRNVPPLDNIAAMIEGGGTVSLGFMAGMYKRVIWVIPSSRPVGETPVDDLKNYFLQRRGFPAAALADFKVDGKHITGTVTGVPLTVTRLEDLSLADAENAIVDIDLYYFMATKIENPAYQTGTRTLLGFLRELGARNVRANLVTVNLSTANTMVAMDLRYYGDVIREALTNPGALNGPMPDAWKYMIQAEDSLGAKRFASAAAIYKDIIETTQDNAGIHFFLAIAEGYQDKGPECRAALLDAYRLDSGYLKGFFQLARVLAAAGKIAAGLDVLDTPDLGKLYSTDDMDYQRGVFFYTAHKPLDAMTHLMRVAEQRPNDFGLFTILFRACREAGNDEAEISALEKLVDIDDGRVRREMPWVYADLGRLYEKIGFPGNASEAYEKYIETKPGDSLSTVFRKRIDAWKAKNILGPRGRP
jgi:tetratricopeptide (TPR) repeat protein